MQAIRIDDLTFKYPNSKSAALSSVCLEVAAGEFVCLCGPTGSGKTTLLRCLKPELAPHGERTGSIEILGGNTSTSCNAGTGCSACIHNGHVLDPAGGKRQLAAARVGYVMQNPDNQIVTDKVWHELAFGLENTGMDPERIRIRVAEMATFFGIHNWFDRDTDKLSGGQKQMLNLASVMAMQPDLLLLDEPTASLDPVAATDFLDTVKRISREIGTTILICEHHLDEVVPMADRLVVMDEGRIHSDGLPEKVAVDLITSGHEMGKAMPAPLRAYIHSAQNDDLSSPAPLDVGSGRRWLARIVPENSEIHPAGKPHNMPHSHTISHTVSHNYSQNISHNMPHSHNISHNISHTNSQNVSHIIKKENADKAISLKDVWFRYERAGADVLRNLSLTVNKGEILCLMGGNGAGKSTIMKLLASETRAYRGKIRFDVATISMLAQNPQLLFTEDTVLADLEKAVTDHSSPSSSAQPDNDIIDLHSLVQKMRLNDLLAQHPYDLSGGEQQRAALAKVLLTDADVLLLDEPTKGLDESFKEKIVQLLKDISQAGKCIVITSHDVDFCAQVSDRCAMVFDGQINGEGPARDFFTGNGFYTTACERMSRGILEGTLFPEEVAQAVKAALVTDGTQSVKAGLATDEPSFAKVAVNS